MSKRQRTTGAGNTADKIERERSPTGSTDPVTQLVGLVVIALLVVRWLIPAESAADGDTLWITELWFATALLWAWSCLRSDRFEIRWSAFDVAVWVLVAGHVISTAVVFLNGAGDRRAALNMAWEWVGLGTSFFLLRQVVSSAIDAKRVAFILVALGVVLSGLGIWQHYVFYPQAAAEYHGMIRELEVLQKDATANSKRIRELQLKMQSNGIPNDEAARRQYENRLQFSSEPFGPFALANTFSGFLVVTLLLAGDLFRTLRRPFSKGTVAAWTGAGLLMGYCLVLTKSRTAWIGLLVGLGCWAACALLGYRSKLNKRALILVLVAAVCVIGLFAVAAIGGGFDKKVISEAPKSLAYRLQYWRGALGILKDHIVLGVGPGNFRHHYLHYKLAEASEEIADPHNLILDLWSSGGVIAVGAFLACVALALIELVRRLATPANETAPENDSQQAPAAWSTNLPGTAAGFLLALLAPVLSGSGDFDYSPLLLFIGWLLAAAALRRDLGAVPLSVAALGGAAIGLSTHLLGAGGIEMPGVVQLLLFLAVLIFADRARATARTRAPWFVLGISGAAVIFLITCWSTAMLPVLNRRTLIAAGDEALLLQGDFARAIDDYGQAAVRDPFSPDPHEKLGEAFFSHWQSGSSTSRREDFEKGEASLKNAIRLDPQNPAWFRRLGEYYQIKFARTQDRKDAQSAVDALTGAVELYPNDSSLRAKRATALHDAGHLEEAKGEAERALELNEINIRQEHTDRYLPDATVVQLRRIAGQPVQDGPNAKPL